MTEKFIAFLSKLCTTERGHQNFIKQITANRKRAFKTLNSNTFAVDIYKKLLKQFR